MQTDNRPTLATIFTGHTLDLTSIEAVSPVQSSSAPYGTNGSYRTLFFEIHLKSGNCLKYTYFKTTYDGKPTEGNLKAYRETVANFKKLRSALLEKWAIAVSGHLIKEGGSES